MGKPRILPCKCGHAKGIHARIYGKSYANSDLPRVCNFPGCKCKEYTPAKAPPER